MSVSNVTVDTSVVQQSARSIRSQAREDFEQLFQSMQAGNAAGAQQAYAALQQLQATAQGTTATGAATDASSGSTAASAVGTATATTPAASPLASDWSSLGQALQSGNMTSAQDAFSKIEQDLLAAAAQGPMHRHHAATDTQATSGSPATAAGTDSANSPAGLVSSDLTSLQQALQSGDTSSAQDLLTKLEQDLQASGQTSTHRHHHGHGGFSTPNAAGAYTAAATTAATGASSTTATGSATSPASATA